MIQIPDNFKGTFAGCSSFESHAPMFKTIIDQINPTNICEIGFYRGSSSYIWLYLSNAKLTSIDSMQDVEFPLNPRPHGGCLANTDKLKELFPNRFTFYQVDSKFIYPFIKDEQFSLIFIDGGHLENAIRNDLNLALKLKIPYILLDDYNGEVEAVYMNEFQNYFETIEIFNTSMLDTGKMNRACFAKLKDRLDSVESQYSPNESLAGNPSLRNYNEELKGI